MICATAQFPTLSYSTDNRCTIFTGRHELKSRLVSVRSYEFRVRKLQATFKRRIENTYEAGVAPAPLTTQPTTLNVTLAGTCHHRATNHSPPPAFVMTAMAFWLNWGPLLKVVARKFFYHKKNGPTFEKNLLYIFPLTSKDAI